MKFLRQSSGVVWTTSLDAEGGMLGENSGASRRRSVAEVRGLRLRSSGTLAYPHPLDHENNTSPIRSPW